MRASNSADSEVQAAGARERSWPSVWQQQRQQQRQLTTLPSSTSAPPRTCRRAGCGRRGCGRRGCGCCDSRDPCPDPCPACMSGKKQGMCEQVPCGGAQCRQEIASVAAQPPALQPAMSARFSPRLHVIESLPPPSHTHTQTPPAPVPVVVPPPVPVIVPLAVAIIARAAQYSRAQQTERAQTVERAAGPEAVVGNGWKHSQLPKWLPDHSCICRSERAIQAPSAHMQHLCAPAAAVAAAAAAAAAPRALRLQQLGVHLVQLLPRTASNNMESGGLG